MTLHVALAADWAAAEASGGYRMSTRGRTFAEVGFVHCARPAQLGGVLIDCYADCPEPLLLVVLDDEALGAALVEEAGFPHLYAPVPPSSVRQVLHLSRSAERPRFSLWPVEGRRAPLAAEALATAICELADWSGDTRGIRRTVTAASFPDAVALVDRVALAAEAHDHHPDIDIRWRTVTFRLTTHSSGGSVTGLDLFLASEIDGLV